MSGSSSPVFQACFRVTVGVEGGLVDNPNDPGGLTNYGISQRAYPNLDIRNLTLDQAEQIYYADYYIPAACDLCPPALAMVTFDCAVNNGVDRAKRCLQEGLGVTADGVIGTQTKAALAALTDVSTAVGNTHGARILFMAGLSTWATFGKGWSRRLALIPYEAAQIATSLGVGGPSA